MWKKGLTVVAMAPFLFACDDSTGPDGGDRVAVRFQAVTPASAAAAQGSLSGPSFDHVPAAGAITLTGTNGTLVIEDIRLIVAEIELERADEECVGLEDDDACEKFEGGPFLVNLLDGSADEVVNAFIPAGSYEELEFEVENLNIDDDDSAAEAEAKQAILTQMGVAYPDFPADASMVVHGTFDGEPFTVYFDAEIELEREFDTAYTVPDDGPITVFLAPAIWFQQGDQVVDLSAIDGETIEFEAEFEDGVVEIEFDD